MTDTERVTKRGVQYYVVSRYFTLHLTFRFLSYRASLVTGRQTDYPVHDKLHPNIALASDNGVRSIASRKVPSKRECTYA